LINIDFINPPTALQFSGDNTEEIKEFLESDKRKSSDLPDWVFDPIRNKNNETNS